jgi:hypothetical protein
MGVKPKRWTALSGDSAVGWQVDRVGQRDEKDNGAVIEEYWGEIVYILCTDLEVREYSWWRSERTIRGAGGTERTCGSHLSSVPANWLVGPRKGELPSKILNLPYLNLA